MSCNLLEQEILRELQYANSDPGTQFGLPPIVIARRVGKSRSSDVNPTLYKLLRKGFVEQNKHLEITSAWLWKLKEIDPSIPVKHVELNCPSEVKVNVDTDTSRDVDACIDVHILFDLGNSIHVFQAFIEKYSKWPFLNKKSSPSSPSSPSTIHVAAFAANQDNISEQLYNDAASVGCTIYRAESVARKAIDTSIVWFLAQECLRFKSKSNNKSAESKYFFLVTQGKDTEYVKQLCLISGVGCHICTTDESLWFNLLQIL